jgi:inorganic pyrophosphatase
MAALNRLPLFDQRGDARMVVEVGLGSSSKHKFDPELEAFVFERHLPVGLVYPAPWGFFPSTLAEDGDPLDAMLWEEPASPQGLVVSVKPLAIARVSQVKDGETRSVRNDRIVVVPAAEVERVRRLSRAEREQLELFFTCAAHGSGHDATVEGWGDAIAARDAIREAAERFHSPARDK